MEGDRILRSILNQSHTSFVVKDVENYLKPTQKLGFKQADIASLKKYHSFALKLLRCSIQSFEVGKNEVCYLIEACQNAITYLETACCYFISTKDAGLCQLERLIKLLYHFLAYLSKTDDYESFKWYSKKTLNFCKSERCLNRTEGSVMPEDEMVTIYDKIFEIHWKVASQVSKYKPFPLNVLSFRMQGLCFLLNSNKDIMKFGKYFEITILSFLQEIRNQNFILEGEIASILTDVVQSLRNYLISDSNYGITTKATIIYLLLLSYKVDIIYSVSKECLGLPAPAECGNKQKANFSSLFQPLIDAHRTHILLRKLSGNKLSQELCKQAKNITKYLQGFALIHEELLNSKLLVENPKIMIIYDIIRVLLSFPEKLCWELLIQLSKLAVNLKKQIEILLKSIFDEMRNSSNKQILEEKRSKIFYTQWYSFACWYLQTIQTWLGTNEKSVAVCSCIAKSQWKMEDLFEDCFSIMENASSILQCMEDNKIDFKKAEYHWIGVASYNMGIIAQKEASLTRIIAFLQLSVLNLMTWVKNGDGDVLVKLQQSNLMVKQKVLVSILLKAGLKDRALCIITEFAMFLLSMNVFDVSLEEARTITKELVSFWINIKEKIDHGHNNGEGSRSISMEIEKISGTSVKSSTLKYIIQCEMTELINRRSPFCFRDSTCLLDFITKKYKETDELLVAESIIDYLSFQEIDLQQRITLCLNARSLLEQSIAKKDYPSYCEDLLAMSYFYLGCCDQKMNFLKSCKYGNEVLCSTEDKCKPKICKHSEMDDTVPEIFDYISSFDMAMKKWDHLIQTAVKSKSKCVIEETFRSAEKTAKCLYYIGSVYCLRHQCSKSIHAFYLSNLIMAHLDSSAINGCLDLWITVSSESVRQLVDLFDLPNSIAILGEAPVHYELDISSNIQLQVAKAVVLTKAGEYQSARDILENILSSSDWINQKTQRSFFQKADALLALALSKESPCATPTDIDHPLILAQEALKIFRNLVSLLFLLKDSGKEDQEGIHWENMQDSREVLPWIALGRILDCLRYIAQRYRFQGCIPEARCHVKEALLLCEQFALHERKLEFLMEEAEASLLSHETDKIEHCLHDISNCARAAFGDDRILHGFSTLYDHADDCACIFCSDICLLKFRIQLLLIKRCYAFLSPKEMNNPELQDKCISDSLMKAERKANAALKMLRNVLKTGKGRKKKKVTFDDNIKVPIESELKNSIKIDALFNLKTDEICNLLWIGYRIEFHCLTCYSAQNGQKSTLLREIDVVLNDMKKLDFFPFISTNYRTSLAKLIQSRVGLYLSSEQGSSAINSVWLPSKAGKRWGAENSTRCSGNNKEPLDTHEANSNVTARCRKQRSSRKGNRQKKKAKEPECDVENDDKEKRQICVQLESEQAIEDLKQLCHEALSYLVPNVHCLQIKGLYQLLSLINGRLCPVQAAYIEVLSFARSLSQQMLVRNVKKERKRSKTGGKHAEPVGDFSTVSIPILNEANSTFSFQNHKNLQQQLVDGLPKDWRICSIRMSTIGIKCLIVTRFQAYQDPIILRIPIGDTDYNEDEDSAIGGLVRDLASAFVTDPLDEFEEILDQSLQSLETEDVKTWWNNRKKLDKRLQKMLNKVENSWLGGWKGVLLGERKDCNYQSKAKETVEEFCEGIKMKLGLELSKSIVEVLFDSYSLMDKVQVNKAFKTLLGSNFIESIVESFVIMADHFMANNMEVDSKSPPVRGRRGRRKEFKSNDASRSPVILVLDKHLQKIPWESMSLLRNQVISRMPSLLLTRLSVLNSMKFFTNGVKTESTFYILNPRNDLQNTQKTFEKWFQSIQGWKGLGGRAPSETEYRSALEDYDMFIYCGHGNGREFLRGDDIQRINCKALTFLIGCSSGKLQIKGDLDARGMALHYLIAGCPAIIANLWDVTDKDIDRFLSKILKDWLEKDVNLMECMPIARDSCLLPYLIGASPVLYGLPVIKKNPSLPIKLK